jgi:hypothetical protein
MPLPLHRPSRLWRRWLGWAAVAVVLLGVLMLYRDPAFMLMLADQVWACF